MCLYAQYVSIPDRRAYQELYWLFPLPKSNCYVEKVQMVTYIETRGHKKE